MDFTFLFIIIMMLLALKSGLSIIAIGLFIILLVTSKNKWLLIATLIGGGLVAVVSVTGVSSALDDPATLAVLGGLFVILLLLARNDTESPAPQGYYPGGGMMG